MRWNLSMATSPSAVETEDGIVVYQRLGEGFGTTWHWRFDGQKHRPTIVSKP